jgi:acyl-coenzyme A synthetase/AMP-(fatty) acid ligase
VLFGGEFTERISEIRDQVRVGSYILAGVKPPAFAEAFTALVEHASPEPVGVELTYDDPCALYFTSGTTGQPKPILLTHKNLVCASITENVHHGQRKEDNFILIPPCITPPQKCTGSGASSWEDGP